MVDVTPDLQKLVKNYVATACDVEKIDRSTSLGSGGLGMDSVSIVMLLLECESKWGVAFPAELLEKQPVTVGILIDHLTTNLAAKT